MGKRKQKTKKREKFRRMKRLVCKKWGKVQLGF